MDRLKEIKRLHFKLETLLEEADFGGATESLDRALDQLEYACDELEADKDEEGEGE